MKNQIHESRNEETVLLASECPLVSELKKLKKSSSEAIDNENSFSNFKKYMHIHRSLEDELKQKIEYAKSSNKKSLILVCGNVGDGKSHIISYLKNADDSLLEGFIIHNDATESRSRQRDEKEELAKLLTNFMDKNLENESNDKIIIAINLGVLSNFIDSEQGKDFTHLAEYINKNKLLVYTDISDYSDNDGYFSHVNFGDYHIYRLIDGKVDSPYISEVIEKIFGDNSDNPFYAQYKKCELCTVKECPVKHNFEMVRQPDISKGIINVLIETIIKDKIILSTRDLLEFFYDIIVHPGFDKQTYSKCRNRILKYIDFSLPNIMFEHDEISPLLSHIRKYDFVTQRTKEFDDITTKFNTTDNIEEIFRKYICDNPAMNYLFSNGINRFCMEENKKNKGTRKALLCYFTRLCKLSPKNNSFAIVNNEFNDFVSDLFYSVQKNTRKLKNLYTTVRKCVYVWNGGSDERINLKNDIEGYIVSAELDLDYDNSCFSETLSENAFEKFPSYINLTLTKKNYPEYKATISIDYDLYKMLKLVENGYRPSAKDNNRFIGFLAFVNRLSEFSSYREEVRIECLKKDVKKKYKLTRNVFGYSFMEVE